MSSGMMEMRLFSSDTPVMPFRTRHGAKLMIFASMPTPAKAHHAGQLINKTPCGSFVVSARGGLHCCKPGAVCQCHSSCDQRLGVQKCSGAAAMFRQFEGLCADIRGLRPLSGLLGPHNRNEVPTLLDPVFVTIDENIRLKKSASQSAVYQAVNCKEEPSAQISKAACVIYWALVLLQRSPSKEALNISGSNVARLVGLAMSSSSSWNDSIEPSFWTTSDRGVVSSCAHMPAHGCSMLLI